MLGCLSVDIICSEKQTVFLERSLRKTVSFEEQIMFKDKYPSIFLPQMEAIVFIIFQIFFTTCTVLKRPVKRFDGLQFMLSGMLFKICKFKKNSVGQIKEKPYFSTIAFFIFSDLQNFQKIGIDMHPIDVVTKNLTKLTNRKGKYWRTNMEIWKKSQSTKSHFTYA